MNRPSHKTEGVNRTKTMWFHPFVSTGNDPRKGWRIPLNEIKYNEQRDEEKERSRGPFASERGDEPRSGIPYCSVYSYTYFGARYMDYELMTMWLSVDPMADKYPSISPYNYCMWNPIKKVDEYGMEADIPPLLAKFCSAERQANSFLNNPKRKGRFVRSAYSSFDADGRETITVRPNYNYADKYDAQSPSDGILLPTIYVTDKGLGDRDFTDGDIYHFFHSIGKKIQHFENNLLPHTDCGLSSRIDRMEIEGAAKVLFYMSLGVSIYEGIAAKAWLSVGSDIVGTGLSHLGNTSHPFPRYFGAVGSTGIDCYTLARPGPSPNIGGGKVSSVMSIINTGVTHYYDNQDKKQ